MKYLRSQSLSDLDAEPPRVGVFELYSGGLGIRKETAHMNCAEVTLEGQGRAVRISARFRCHLLSVKSMPTWEVTPTRERLHLATDRRRGQWPISAGSDERR